MKLLQKGMDKELIDRALEHTFRDVDEYEQALAIAKRRARTYKKLDEKVMARRLTGYIVRRGFSFDTALKVTKTIVKDANYQE